MSEKATHSKSKNSPPSAEEGKKKTRPASSSGPSSSAAKARPRTPSVTEAPVGKPSGKVPSPKKTSVRKSETLSSEDRHRKIAEVAYFISERRGFVDGSSESDWYEAEAYLRFL